MAIIVYDPNGNIGAIKSVTVDQFGRIYLSSAMADTLGTKGLPFQSHLGYDPDTRSIALARIGTVTNANYEQSVTFEAKRRYTSARRFLREHNLILNRGDKAVTYVFTEKANNWYLFRRADEEGVKLAN